MTLQDQIDYYNTEWSITDRQYANSLQLTRTVAILREILETGFKGTGAIPPSICDLGAGTGWLTAILGCVGDALGVELSDVAVEIARKRFSNARFECADVVQWDYPRSAFDIVVSHEVLEHLVDQQAYIEVAYGLLKPGGWLILTTPNARTVQATPSAIRSNQPVENALTAAQLRDLLTTRFRNIHTRTIILGGGSLGLYRVVNSRRAHALLRTVGLDRSFTAAALAMGFGLHLVARAQKPAISG